MANYITRTDLETAYGIANIELWGSFDPSDSGYTSDDRVNVAIEIAEGEIDAVLRATSGYTIPVSSNGNSLYLIKDIAVVKAATWIYCLRGVFDENDKNKLQQQLDRVNDLLLRIARGQIRLDATRIANASQVPVVCK